MDLSSQIDDPSEYHAYMLRLWHTHSAGERVWRVALEEPLTQEVIRFDSLAGLFAFLQAQTGQDRPDTRPRADGASPLTLGP